MDYMCLSVVNIARGTLAKTLDFKLQRRRKRQQKYFQISAAIIAGLKSCMLAQHTCGYYLCCFVCQQRHRLYHRSLCLMLHFGRLFAACTATTAAFYDLRCLSSSLLVLVAG